MIKKKNNNNTSILLNLLFKSRNMYGEFLISTNKEILPFIYGNRHDHSIINLKNVSFFLKRIFKLIKHIIQRNEKILIIGNSDEIKFLFTTTFKKKHPNIIIFTNEWINGLITNKILNTTFNKIIHFLIKKKKIKLILIIKSSTKDIFLNKEISTLKIPIISLINTNQIIKKIDYPIVTNTKNIKSIYIIMYLLRKIF
uniref:ribosomal protein S2 n=1 Tax=Peronosclerospora sorghi TaxID=230839 RepID=UPI0022FD55D0|nr:ribosomal protein S2 [Peronosclerospora sorghi]WAU47946.1 ribosomal protein S2 [Peronosclerospora sorghi]